MSSREFGVFLAVIGLMFALAGGLRHALERCEARGACGVSQDGARGDRLTVARRCEVR